MSEFKLEIGDIWENKNYQIIINKVYGLDIDNPALCECVIQNKNNKSFSEENCTGLVDLKKYYTYKGKAKHLVTEWFEVKDD